jgi:hypothetical protein
VTTALYGRNPNWIEAVSVCIPALLSGTFLIFYKAENEELRKVEHDTRSVQQIHRLLELTNAVEDETIRATMYEKIAKLIVPPD